jgi:hypothetical protein
MAEDRDNLNEIGKKPEKFDEKESKKEGISLFFGEQEATFFTEAGREITEDILKESFLFYRIDLIKTKPHPLYGEAKKKIWHPEVKVYGSINVEAGKPAQHVPGGLVKKGMGKITANVYFEHLKELNLIEEIDGQQIISLIKMGDFIGYKNQFYQITDDGHSQINNEHSWAGDRRFFITIEGIEIDEDVFKAR